MDGHHPKRRKDKYNPYTIAENNGVYMLSFRDGNGVTQCMEIDKELFDVLDGFELDDISFLNEVDRHYEQSELTEAALYDRSADEQEGIEDIVLRSLQYKALHKGIDKLPETQRRRLRLYYFGGFTYEQIAAYESCTIMPVKRSIDAAKEKLKKLLK